MPRTIRELCTVFDCDTCTMEPSKSAFGDVLRSVTIKPSLKCISVDQLLVATIEAIRRILQHCLENGEHVKAFVSIKALMQKLAAGSGKVEKEDRTHLSTKAMPK